MIQTFYMAKGTGNFMFNRKKQKEQNFTRKSDFRLALSTFGTILISILISFVVVFVTAPVLDKVWGCVVAEIAILFIFLSMMYSPLWYEGDRDKNLVQFGHIKEDKLRGLRVGLLLMIPFLLSNILMVMAKCEVFISSAYWAVYKIINIYVWPLSNLLAPQIFDAPDVPWSTIGICASIMLIIPLTTTVAYLLGYYRVSVSSKLIYKNGKDKQK